MLSLFRLFKATDGVVLDECYLFYAVRVVEGLFSLLFISFSWSPLRMIGPDEFFGVPWPYDI